MAALHRVTPTYHVPATQNTAPVLEFRCLYTHDLFKKQKKWHDGSLRYHTFNRRVMVYDDVKNYIGDLHYRQDEEFGEGLELQLDRPVKVEVGEPLGQTQTDLAPLLDRGRGEGRSLRHNSASNYLVRRTNVVGLHNVKPKSLIDVLGPKQNRTGRARLPVQSPYEQRQTLNQTPIEVPLSKKPRIESEKENDQSRTKPAKNQQRNANSHTKLQTDTQDVTPRPKVKEKAQQIVDISSDNELPRGDQSTKTGSSSTAKASTKPSSKSNNGLATKARSSLDIFADSTHHSRLDGQHKQKRKNKKQTHIIPKSPDVMPSKKSQSQKRISATAQIHGPTTRLRLLAPSSRKKLMYKALLPHKGDLSGSDLAIAQSERELTAATARNDENALQLDTMPAATDLGPTAPITSHQQQECPGQTATRTDINDVLPNSSSPMFCTQDLSQVSPMPQDVAQSQDTDFISSDSSKQVEAAIQIPHDSAAPSIDITSVEQTRPHPLTSPQITEGQPIEECTDRLPIETSNNNHAVNSLYLAQNADAIIDLTVLQPDSRTLRRAVSDSDSAALAVGFDKPHHLHSNSPRSPDHNKVMVTLPVVPIETPLRQPVQRAQSDSAALLQMKMASPITVRPSQMVQPKSADQGPWTELEAFLLFDKWPAAKAGSKPTFDHDRASKAADLHDDHTDYETDEDIQLSMDAKLGTRIQSIGHGSRTSLPGIRSARAVLRDEF